MGTTLNSSTLLPSTTNQPTNQPSTCLLPTPTSLTRVSSVRSATPSLTLPTTSPRPFRAALLRLPRRPTSSRPRATFPETTPSPTVPPVLSVLPATSSTSTSTRVLLPPTSTPFKRVLLEWLVDVSIILQQPYTVGDITMRSTRTLLGSDWKAE